MCEEAVVYDLTTKKEKSMTRCYAGNLWGVVLWLAIITIVVSFLLGVASTATFTQSVTIGGLVAAVIFLAFIAPMVMAAAERKMQEVERNYEQLGKEHHATQDKLRDADRFIKEFVSLRDVLEHMKVVRDDYRKRVTHALTTVRELAQTERNSARKLQEAIQILGQARNEVSGGEHLLREACALAQKHGFETSPIEHYLGEPEAGVEGRNERPGQ